VLDVAKRGAAGQLQQPAKDRAARGRLIRSAGVVVIDEYGLVFLERLAAHRAGVGPKTVFVREAHSR
jgi:hypothetical protein